MAYLDDTGLAYFWGKIKAWANSVFALLGHKHPSSDVNAMTGYSMPASSGAISSGDTLNQAVGKLEKAITAADISNVVHRTGDENISGIKSFQHPSIVLQQPDIEFTNDSSKYPNENKYLEIFLADKNYDPSTSTDPNRAPDLDVTRFGELQWCRRTNGIDSFEITLRELDENDNAINGDIGIAYTPSTGIFHGYCPSTPESRTAGTDIVTRDWIPKDTRIVHITGDETITGSKTIQDASFSIKTSSLAYSETPSGNNKYLHLEFLDKNNDRFGLIEFATRTSGSYDMKINCTKKDGTVGAQLFLGYDANGRAFSSAVSTSEDRTGGTDIITRDWFYKKTLYLDRTSTGNGAIDFITDRKFSSSTSYNTVGATFSLQCLDVDKTGSWGYLAFYSHSNTHSSYPGGTYAALCVHLTNTTYNSNNVHSVVLWKETSSTTFRPNINGTILLGKSNYRWKEIWCTQSSLNSSSDVRFKSEITKIPDNILDAWDSVEWTQYKFNDAISEKGIENARFHTGLVAQNIEKVFKDKNLDISNYGLFLYDKWDEQQEERNEDGEVMYPYMPAGDSYGLRYTEVLCMEAAYMRRENARLKKRVADLEDRLAALEMKLS